MRKSLAPNAEAKKAGSSKIGADKTPRPLFQRAEPAEYSKCRSSGYTLWKARLVRFCHFVVIKIVIKPFVIRLRLIQLNCCDRLVEYIASEMAMI